MNKKQLVWDLPLRLFHWLLVSTIMLLWLTGELGIDYRQYHFYLGYFVLFLITFRLIWGFVGTKYSRFSQFFPTPKRLLRYLSKSKSKLTPKPLQESGEIPEESISPKAAITLVEPIGHNPLGALMVFAMLLLVAIQAGSGLFLSDDIIFDGPYFGVLSSEMQKLANALHYYAFNLILLSVALHISAIIYHQLIKKHDLVIPMITGKKSDALFQQNSDVSNDSADENKNESQIPLATKGIKHSALIKALFVALISAGFIYWLVVLNAPVVEEFYY